MSGTTRRNGQPPIQKIRPQVAIELNSTCHPPPPPPSPTRANNHVWSHFERRDRRTIHYLTLTHSRKCTSFLIWYFRRSKHTFHFSYDGNYTVFSPVL